MQLAQIGFKYFSSNSDWDPHMNSLKHCCCDKLVIFFSMSRWLRASMKSVPFQGRFPSGEVSGLPPHASTKTSRTWEFEALQFIMNIQTTVNCHKLDKGWCQVNGCNHLYPPFTCLDENIKNMEVWSVSAHQLCKCL